jgi:hypothetical protein
MKIYFSTCLLVAIAMVCWEWGQQSLSAPLIVRAQEKVSDVRDNEELSRIFAEDQGDRTPKDGKEIDWKVVSPRDQKRQTRVRELYEKGELHTGLDYFHAGLVFQHGSKPEDYLLAHEFAVLAAVKGAKGGLSLAAASEDRFLMAINRPQRFGTQYKGMVGKSGVTLYEVGPGVTDKLRKEFHSRTLAEAKAREAEFN